MLQDSLFVPVLSSILRNRKLVLAALAATAMQLGLVSLRLPAWPCPFFHLSGVPCPGCGLTRATLLLLKGDWRAAINFHAFAPFLVIAVVLSVSVSTLPQFHRERALNGLDKIERRTGVVALLLFSLIVYWLARLLIMRSVFVQLIQG